MHSSTTVIGPGEIHVHPKESLILKPARLPDQGGVAFMKLVTRKEKQSYDEGWSGGIRNLLIVKHNASESSWLFPDQSLHLVSIQEWPDKNLPLQGLSILTRPANGPTAAGKLSMYLVRHDGLELQEVLKGLDEVIGQTYHQNELRVVYQKELSVRSARISFSDWSVISDIELARIATTQN